MLMLGPVCGCEFGASFRRYEGKTLPGLTWFDLSSATGDAMSVAPAPRSPRVLWLKPGRR